MIPVTQYMRPNGSPAREGIERPAEIEALAREVISMGGRFEAEVLMGGYVSLTVAVHDIGGGEPGDCAIKLVENGPGIPIAFDALVKDAHAWLRRGTPEETET